MISWESQQRAHINRWYWVGGVVAFLVPFSIVYWDSRNLLISLAFGMISFLTGIAMMLSALYYVLPVAIAISELGIHLRYRKKERTIPWKSIERILKQDLRAYGGAFGLYIYMKNGKKKRLGGDAETLEKIYNQFQSYKQSRKGD